MQLDRDILFVVNREWTHPILDWITATLTAGTPWIWASVLTLAASLAFGSRRTRTCALLCLLTFAVSDALYVRGGKLLFERPRPREVLADVRSVHLARVSPRVLAFTMPLAETWSAPTGPPRRPRSFPSGHAWNSFTLATVMAACHRRRGWLAYPFAALVAYSRVYTGAHWPSDVVLSALLAVPTTLVTLFALDRAWAWLGPRVAPALHETMPRLPPFEEAEA